MDEQDYFETEQPAEEPSEKKRVPAVRYSGKFSAKRKNDEKGNWQTNLLMYLHDIIYLLAAIVVIFVLVFRVVVVSGTSMNHTLMDGDYLLLLGRVFYTQPEYGDIIVASKDTHDNGAPIVKRVIATQGQWVDIDFEAGVVYVGQSLDEMQALDEEYLDANNITTDWEGINFPQQVPDGCVFVLGDNRGNSKDSRDPDIGMIDQREILGKVIFLFLPGTNKGAVAMDFNRIGVVY